VEVEEFTEVVVMVVDITEVVAVLLVAVTEVVALVEDISEVLAVVV
jgi:hypothetical protein